MSTNTMSYHDRIRKNQKDVDELLFTEQEEDNQLQLEADLRGNQACNYEEAPRVKHGKIGGGVIGK